MGGRVLAIAAFRSYNGFYSSMRIIGGGADDGRQCGAQPLAIPSDMWTRKDHGGTMYCEFLCCAIGQSAFAS